MSLFDLLLIIPAFIVLVTAVDRLNDIQKELNSKRWWARRIGLGMTSIAMVMAITSYFSIPGPYWAYTTRFLGLWGWALTWLTTPGMPPWWKYISRYDEKVP